VAQDERFAARRLDEQTGDLIEKHADELAQLESLDNASRTTWRKAADLALTSRATANYGDGGQESREDDSC